MPVVVNLQRRVNIKSLDFRPFASRLTTIDEAAGRDFALAFVSDRRMTELNKLFRGRPTTTDVLSFPSEPDEFEKQTARDTAVELSLGDIVISAEQAARQATENRISLEREIMQLMLHGFLHLCGYDHETDSGEMNRRELDLRDKLGI